MKLRDLSFVRCSFDTEFVYDILFSWNSFQTPASHYAKIPKFDEVGKVLAYCSAEISHLLWTTNEN
jgi:hypothetical protein